MPLLESEFEDWICANVDAVVPGGVLIGRQMRLVNGGILDVLIAKEIAEGILCLTVVEIKRGAIDPAAVAQLLTYIGALGELEQKVDALWYNIDGIVAGTSITDDAALAVKATGGLVSYAHLSVRIEANLWKAIRVASAAAAAERAGPVLSNALIQAFPGFQNAGHEESL